MKKGFRFNIWCSMCHSDVIENVTWDEYATQLADDMTEKHVCTRCPDCDKLISNYFGHNCKPYWKRENQ